MARGAAVIAAIWALGIAVLVVGTLTQAPIGFVWPMGQDIDWSLFLKQGIGLPAAVQEFTADHRNPLSGWVYSLAAPLILGHQYGFHSVRLLACLMLGLSIYALAWQFGRGRALTFPTMLGATVAIWWFWSNYTQVVWIMLFALALSVLVVWTYCLYVDSSRTRGTAYGMSLALWLVVLGTYSIQCGAIVAVGLVALFRGEWRGWRTVGAAFCDLIPYTVIGAAFGLTWLTAASGFFADSGVQQTTHVNISASALLQSLQYFLWHPAFTRLAGAVMRTWSPGAIALTICLVALLVVRIKPIVAAGEGSPRAGAGWTLVTMVCLALPTTVLEATSATWGPGLRSDMMFAGFFPTLVLCAIALAFPPRHAARALFAGSTVLAAAIALLSFEQNMQAVAASRWQRNLATGLLPYQQATPSAIHFIVVNKSGQDFIGDHFGPRFVQDKLNRTPKAWSLDAFPTESSMRIVDSLDGTPAWPLSIGPDVVRGALYASSESVPRSTVRIVTFDGQSVSEDQGKISSTR